MKEEKQNYDNYQELFTNFVDYLLVEKNNKHVLELLEKEATWIDNTLSTQPAVVFKNKKQIKKMLITSNMQLPDTIKKESLSIKIKENTKAFCSAIITVSSFVEEKKDTTLIINLLSNKNDQENYLINNISISKCKHNSNSKGGFICFNYDFPLSIKYISDELASLLSYTSSSKMLFDCNAKLRTSISKKDKKNLENLFDKALINHEKFEFVLPIKNALAIMQMVKFDAQIIKLKTETIVIAKITNQDDTINQELNLEDIKQQLFTLLQHFNGPVFWKDSNQKYQGINSSFLQYFNNKNYIDIIGKNDFELFGKQQGIQFSQPDRDILNGKLKFSNNEGCFKLNKQTFFFNTFKIPIYNNEIIFGSLCFMFNVTKDERYKQIIKNKEHITDYIFDNSNIPYFAKDSNRRFVRANNIVCKIFDIQEKDIIGKKVSDFLPQKESLIFDRFEKKAIKEKEEIKFNFTKQNIYYNVTITPILDEDRSVFRLISKFTDITQEVEREKQIIESYNQNLDILSYDKMISYARIDLDTQDFLYLRLNNRVINTINIKYSNELLLSKKKFFIYDFEFDKLFNELSFKNLNKSYNNNKKLKLDYSIKYKTNFYKFNIAMNYNFNPITEHREAIILSKNITDIVLTKETVLNLAAKEFDYIAGISLYADLVNMYYYNPNEIDFSTIINSPTIANFIDIIFESNKTHKPDIYYIKSIIRNVIKTHQQDYLLIETIDGKFKNIIITPLDDKKQSVIFVCKDLSEINRKELEVQKRIGEITKEAQLTSKINSDFINKISHDIRTPLTAIRGLSNFGIKEALEENTKEYFKKIASNSRYLSSLLNDFLELQKIESSTFTLKPTQIYAPSIIEKVESILSPKIIEKNINFNIIAENRGQYFIYNDEGRIIEILVHIIHNAIKYTKPNGNITWKYKYIKKPNLHVQHIIMDEGIGMSKNFQKIMSDKFTKERNIFSDTEDSTGLGLAVVNNLLKVMGGNISCKSMLNKGTTIVITIPLTLSSRKEFNKIESSKPEINRHVLYGKKILLYDNVDNKNSRTLKTLLHEYKMKVDVANNGIEGINLVNLKKYDAIIMDLMMPVMDSLEATTQIRKTYQKIPIIALSADKNQNDIKRSLEAGRNAHIQKPIDKEVLFDTLATYIK